MSNRIDTGRIFDDDFEPKPMLERIGCPRLGKPKDLTYLRQHVYNHQSSVCPKCVHETLCKEKEERRL